MNDATFQREALRQRVLLRALWHDEGSGVLQAWARGAQTVRGLRAYRANAGAAAERALAAALPTVQQLVGDDSFVALARAFWQVEPPQRGDLAHVGERMPRFIAGNEQLATEPYLADCARLDWAVHRAESAADASPEPQGVERLAGPDALHLHLALRPGTALVTSRHPIATIWLAHRSDDGDRFAPVRAAFAEGRTENALVWRDAFRVRVSAISDADARFTQALLDDRPLAQALGLAGDGFDFNPG